MQTFPKTVSVTELRTKTREVIRMVMESDEPILILYNSQAPVCLVKTQSLAPRVTVAENQDERIKRQKVAIMKLAGFLKHSKAFEGVDPVEYQKRIRSEWDR